MSKEIYVLALKQYRSNIVVIITAIIIIETKKENL